MNIFTSRIIIALIAVFFALTSGLWLSKIGRPLNTALFNVHKIISLLALIFAILGIIQLAKNVPADTHILLLYIVGGLSAISALTSGGMLSFDKFGIPLILNIHKISTIILLISGGLALYFSSTAK